MENGKLKIVLGYLYGDLMNIYGDTGNIICLQKRGEWRGIKVEVKNITIGTPLKKGEVDLYFFGGGQDESQVAVSQDLARSDKGKVIREDVERGVPVLSICGGYQLLGASYKPSLKGNTLLKSGKSPYKPQNAPKLPGLGIFPITTEAGEKRMIGNIIISTQFGDLVGFENHSGKTHLKKSGIALGMVQKGFGNNGEDKAEGCLYKNAIGCYMHGSLLPKNPKLADWLLRKALETRYGKTVELPALDDSLEEKARFVAIKRFSK